MSPWIANHTPLVALQSVFEKLEVRPSPARRRRSDGRRCPPLMILLLLRASSGERCSAHDCYERSTAKLRGCFSPKWQARDIQTPGDKAAEKKVMWVVGIEPILLADLDSEVSRGAPDGKAAVGAVSNKSRRAGRRPRRHLPIETTHPIYTLQPDIAAHVRTWASKRRIYRLLSPRDERSGDTV